MKFGIEIETVGLTPREAQEALTAEGVNVESLGYTHRVLPNAWKVLTDGSITGRRGRSIANTEVVSPPMEYNEANIEQVRKVCKILNDAGADVNRSCGVHVHIEVANEDPRTIANVYNRYRKFEADVDGWMPPSRRGTANGYCGSMANQRDVEFHSMADVRRAANNVDTRYLKLNMASFVRYGTIEFRHHAGSINGSKLSHWIHFLHAFVVASREPVPSPVATSDDESKIDGLAPKRKALFLLIRDSRPRTLVELAEARECTKQAVRDLLAYIRQAGLQVIVNQDKTLSYVNQESAAAVINETDTVWAGIPEATRTYYVRRAGLLA